MHSMSVIYSSGHWASSSNLPDCLRAYHRVLKRSRLAERLDDVSHDVIVKLNEVPFKVR